MNWSDRKSKQTGARLLSIDHIPSQQHAGASQVQICKDCCTQCHTEIEAADQTCSLALSHCIDIGLASPGTVPKAPGAWQGRHYTSDFLIIIIIITVIIIMIIIAFKGAIQDFFTISSQRRELSPTRTLKWPRRNRVKSTCNTSSADHKEVSCYVPLGTKGQLSY